MTRLYDGKKMVEITMNTWNGSGYSPDFSGDFFEVGNLPYDGEKDCYIVDDVDYCVDFAKDYMELQPNDYMNHIETNYIK